MTERILESTLFAALALVAAAALTPAPTPHQNTQIQAPTSENTGKTPAPSVPITSTPADAEAEPDAPAAVAPAVGVLATVVQKQDAATPVAEARVRFPPEALKQSAAPAARYTASQPRGPLWRWLGRRR